MKSFGIRFPTFVLLCLNLFFLGRAIAEANSFGITVSAIGSMVTLYTWFWLTRERSPNWYPCVDMIPMRDGYMTVQVVTDPMGYTTITKISETAYRIRSSGALIAAIQSMALNRQILTQTIITQSMIGSVLPKQP